MAYLVYSKDNPISLSLAEAVIDEMGLEPDGMIGDCKRLRCDSTEMVEITGSLLNSEYLDGLLGTDLIVFLSSHKSKENIPSFTTHSEGNWGENAELGGRPRELSYASPANMLCALQSLNKLNSTQIAVTYEATHHGPLLKTPSLFLEMGGDDRIAASRENAEIVAKGVSLMLDKREPEYDKVAVGIGGTHYPERFTRLAKEGKYAFSHIMSRYNVGNVEMLDQALERSDIRPEVALIEWKSIKAPDRQRVIERLGALGLDYERA